MQTKMKYIDTNNEKIDKIINATSQKRYRLKAKKGSHVEVAHLSDIIKIQQDKRYYKNIYSRQQNFRK
jgi:hypothetical protein